MLVIALDDAVSVVMLGSRVADVGGLGGGDANGGRMSKMGFSCVALVFRSDDIVHLPDKRCYDFQKYFHLNLIFYK